MRRDTVEYRGGGGVYGGIGGYMGGRKWLVSEGNTRVNCRYF